MTASSNNEIELSLKTETISEERFKMLVQMNENPKGILIKPDQVSIIRVEDEQPQSYGLGIALTWADPNRLPFRLVGSNEGERFRRIAVRVDRQYLVQFAQEILKEYAPQALRKD